MVKKIPKFVYVCVIRRTERENRSRKEQNYTDKTNKTKGKKSPHCFLCNQIKTHKKEIYNMYISAGTYKCIYIYYRFS